MNREILFRGLRVDGNGWLYGNIQVPTPPFDQYFMWDGPQQYRVIPEKVGQYTGLKDKNGKLIFEGDFMKCYVGHESRKNDLYTVVFRLGCASLDNNLGETPVSFATCQDQLWHNLDYDSDLSDNFEITGNIHEKQEPNEN